MNKRNLSLTIFLAAIFSLSLAGNASATLDQAKLYQATLGGDAKPKCVSCHVDKIPKKDDGKHELNDYGKKLTAVNPKPDEATYKQVGVNPDAV